MEDFSRVAQDNINISLLTCQFIWKDYTLNRRRRCPRMKRRRFPRRSHWRFGAALAGWGEEVDDHLILWRNKTTPETQLGPNRDTPATANVKRFFMGYKESARSKLEAMMFRWVIEDGCHERGERWKWSIMIEEVSHHVWRSVLEARTILEECGSLWRYWREELRQQQEDGQDLWMDDLDKYNFWLEPPDDVSGQRPTGLGWWSPHYQRERTRSKL